MSDTKMTSEELKSIDFADLLDTDLDTIEDLPDYVTPVKGYYELSHEKVEQVTLETNDGDVEAIKLTYATVRCVEKNNPEDEDTPEGGMFTQTFPQGTGIQRLKKLYAAVIQQNNCKSIRELITLLPTIHVNASIDHRFAKDDRKTKEKPFPDVANITQA